MTLLNAPAADKFVTTGGVASAGPSSMGVPLLSIRPNASKSARVITVREPAPSRTPRSRSKNMRRSRGISEVIAGSAVLGLDIGKLLH